MEIQFFYNTDNGCGTFRVPENVTRVEVAQPDGRRTVIFQPGRHVIKIAENGRLMVVDFSNKAVPTVVRKQEKTNRTTDVLLARAVISAIFADEELHVNVPANGHLTIIILS